MSDQILIELRAIRDEQLAQGKMLARVDERTLAIDDKVDTHLSEDRAIHSDIEKRVRPLERFRIKAAAMIAVVAFAGSVIVGIAKEAMAAVFFHN